MLPRPTSSIAAAAAAIALLAGSATAQVVHLTFDDPADLGSDSSGNGNDAGVNAGAGFNAAGISGGAADLTANNGYFNFLGEENPVEDLLEGSLTYSIWVNTTQVFASENSNTFEGAAIIYADVFGTPGGTQSDAIPMALVGSKLGSTIGNANQTDFRSTSDINTGQWTHLAISREVGVDVRLYIDGQLEDVEPEVAAVTDLSGRNELILGGNLIDSRYFSGLLDDFQAYDRVLTADEITTLFNNPGSPVPEPSGLLGLAASALLLRRRRA